MEELRVQLLVDSNGDIISIFQYCKFLIFHNNVVISQNAVAVLSTSNPN